MKLGIQIMQSAVCWTTRLLSMNEEKIRDFIQREIPL